MDLQVFIGGIFGFKNNNATYDQIIRRVAEASASLCSIN